MRKRNDIVIVNDTCYRILAEDEQRILAINCVKREMPVWYAEEEAIPFKEGVEGNLQMIETMAGKHLEAFETASVSRQNEAYKRYSMISAAVSVIADKKHYTRLLDEASKLYSVSKQTLRKYLWEYLVYQDIECLLPAEKKKEGRELTADEKNFRRALNKWFYNQDQHSLKWTYRQMLKEKYCDPDGKLLSERPSFDQFRYYYRQSKSQQNYLISRNGLGDYQRNERPLLGDCIQSRFPNIGVGMLDGTVCDIYLVNQSGNVVGRPILTACIDANTSLCCGYCLSWEGGTYNLRNLMQNVIADKAEWCRKHNITIETDDWPCSSLPGVMITDKGSEYISENFAQLVDAGVTLIDLEPFRPDLKPMVEKFFDVIQSYFKNELKGKGVVEKDFGCRTNRTDYRKQACLTLEQFEQVIIRSIIFYNSQRLLENYPYTEEMIRAGNAPVASAIWNFKRHEMGTNLIDINPQS